VDNVLFLNDQGPYFDEGIETLETEAQLNGSQLRNRQPSSGNRIADPLFVSFGTGNYRLRPGSPAIDKAVYTGSLLVDQQGNPRAVGIPGTGINAPNAIDAGAFEYQGENVIIDGLGVGYYDESATTDPDEPGRVLTIRRHPIWEFNPSNPFRSMRGWVLPGRMRVTPFQDESVAFAWRRANDIAQPQGKVARVRATVESRAETNRMTFRLRANWNDRFDSAKILVIDGPQAFAAPPGGREYSMLVDLAQGDYANLQPGQLAPIPYLFNMDTIDFGVAFPSPSVDLTNLQVDLLDRDALVSEFTQIAQRWTFATGTEGWEFQPPPPGYGSPIARHSAPRQALEMAQLQFFSYGTWAAPIVDLAPGTDFLIQFRVSSDRPRETSTSFRVRASDFTFMTTQELVITASANGEATPVPAGRVYTVFGTVCPLADVSGLRFFWDLYGFDGETRGGSLFLEEVTILTKPTN
jgi:hypothetical protein